MRFSHLPVHLRWLYAVYGVLFGMTLPVAAIGIRYVQFGANALWVVLLNDPLVWIIITAPLFWGTFVYIVGMQRDKVAIAMQQLRSANEQLTNANQEIHRQIELVEEQSRDIEIANSQMNEVNTKLVAANEFKVKMLSIAAHDLKNPISNILLSVQLLRRKSDGRSIPEYTESIKESGEQMLRIIDDLLDSAALDLGKTGIEFRSFDIVRTLRAAYSQYIRIFEAKAQHSTMTCPEECAFQGDEARIRQVIDNLLSNASKYSPIEGTITMSLENIGSIIRLSVSDTGPGLTEDDKTKLFGMFQRLSAQPTGGESSSGVGLASVKNIVELHGGTIEVQSELGKGSTFILTLPLVH
jgi:signal transduction histidine kinase